MAASQRRVQSFKVVVRRIEQPFSDRPMDDLDWICKSLGLLEIMERENKVSTIFKEIVRSTESGETLTSTEISSRIGMSRGAVINHLNTLMRSGLIVRNGRYYFSRSKSIYRTIEEIEEDIDRIFEKMKRAALGIDEKLGVRARGSART